MIDAEVVMVMGQRSLMGPGAFMSKNSGDVKVNFPEFYPNSGKGLI
jgi:hypothetical protein